jgi:ABC-type Fe3+-hydroxamate transport system substrate-binding protein
MAFFIDQTERRITLNKIPQRIISLVPSQTELLFDLGLAEQVIGITKFCIHPDKWFRSKTRIGGTKQLNMELIQQLQPDLIIANKEENVKEQVEELQNYFPVWISDINNLEDAYEMIEQVGLMTNKQKRATKIVFQIKDNFAELETRNSKLTACYLIWQNPYMTIGGNTFINSMLEAARFENIFAKEKRYPEATIDELIKLKPEILLLSSEPFPFKQKHADELLAQLPNTKIVVVDGEMFSWYGSRLLKAPAYFKQLWNESIDKN